MAFLRRSTRKIVPPSTRLSISGTMLTNTGCVRELNEDVVAYSLPGSNNAADQDMLALVADGMGGHAAGEVASRIAADTVLRLYYERNGSPTERLNACLSAANKAIYERSRTDPACAGMGTTCTALAIRSGAAFLGHVGDSRAYMLRGGQLQQISEDHSLVAQMVRDGTLSAEEAARSPDRNIILRALGNEARVKPAVWREGMPLLVGDVLLLCSDGLSDVVDDKTIGVILGGRQPFEACQALIDAAVAAGGPDNVSAGVFVVGIDRAWAGETQTTRPLPPPVNGAGK